MTNSDLAPQSSSPGNALAKKQPRLQKFVLLIVGFLITCLLMGYLVEIVPRYISLSIHPPDYYRVGNMGDWDRTTYSNFLIPFLPHINSRVYILRKEAIVVDKQETWDSIISYFDNEFTKNGWVRSDTYAPCSLYLPEAQFLKKGKDGYVYYRKGNYQPMIDFEEGDLACLAVWKESGAESFKVVLLTARPSFLTIFNDIF
jgi:hypothetical protein